MKKRFKVEVWTKIIGDGFTKDLYAVIMPNGSPCAFGSQEAMQKWADHLNKTNGVVVAA